MSGKSSIIHLLERFYDTTKGTVSIDGIDVKDMSLKQLRGSFFGKRPCNADALFLPAGKPYAPLADNSVILFFHIRGDIAFSHVSFSKLDEGASAPYEILHDISFQVKAGKTIGIPWQKL